MTQMDELIARVKAATGPDRELDGLIEVATVFRGNDGYQRVGGRFYASNRRVVASHEAPAYTASIDAAMTLVPEGVGLTMSRYWVGWSEEPVWSVEIATGGVPEQPRQVFDCYDAPTPALALVAASLRSRQEKTYG